MKTQKSFYRKNFSKPARPNKYSPFNNNVKPICPCKDPLCPYEKGTRMTKQPVAELLVERPEINIEL